MRGPRRNLRTGAGPGIWRDRLRGPAVAPKEWQHFIFELEGRRVLVNLARMPAPWGGAEHRAIVLVRDEQGWWGQTWTQAVDESAGHHELRLEFAGARLELVRGCWELSLEAPGGVRLEARIEPTWAPTGPSRTRLTGARSMSWVVAPHCRASGSLMKGSQAWLFESVPCYHDHNWGDFEWGPGTGWTWCAAVVPEADRPTALVLSSLGNRAGTRIRDEGLYLWSGDPVPVVFGAGELTLHSKGCLSAASAPCVPPLGRMVLDGASSVPEELVVQAAGPAGQLELRLECVDLARIVVPDDEDPLGCTVINEVHTSLRARGRVMGREVDLTAPAILEVVHGG